MKMLNLGCGTRTCARPGVINMDWSIYLRLKRNPLLNGLVPLFLKGERLSRYNNISRNIVVHNLTKKLPFPADSIDIVFHSHMLEHLDRKVAGDFLLEIKRVLVPGGIQRIVVPDLEKACRAYISHISTCETDPREAGDHERYIASIIEQSVRKEASGTSQKAPLARFFENAFLGDARKRGETHQWMYDRVSLVELLSRLGFRNVTLQHCAASLIPDWNLYGLDFDEHGNEYSPDSLYVEAQK